LRERSEKTESTDEKGTTLTDARLRKIDVTKSLGRADEIDSWKIKLRPAARKMNSSEGQIWLAKKTDTGQGYPMVAKLSSQNQTKTNQA
jgi:hypothetical protein